MDSERWYSGADALSPSDDKAPAEDLGLLFDDSILVALESWRNGLLGQALCFNVIPLMTVISHFKHQSME
jgi:hypothetical protein